MKNFIFILTLSALILASCTNTGKQQNGKASNTETASAETVVYDADTLYAIAESFVDQPITVKGYVTHTCKHAGKRCFITGDQQKFSIRVEAKGSLTTANPDGDCRYGDGR